MRGAVVWPRVRLDLHDPSDPQHAGRVAHQAGAEEPASRLDDGPLQEEPEPGDVAQV
jgi:hypothetical protein